jgi:hypothetical protein
MSTTVTSAAWVELADSTAARLLVTPIIRTEITTPRRLHLVEAPSKVAAGLVDGQPPGASATKHSYFDSSRNSAFVTAELALLGNKLFAQADGIEVDVALNKTGV